MCQSINHRSVPNEVAKALEGQNQGIAGQAKEGQFPELKEPHLVLASPAGIESTTPQSTHQHSGEHHAITSGGHTSISSGKSLLASAEDALRMFSYKAGIRLISAVSGIEFKALDKSINLLAKVKITATAQRVEITAKEEIVINGGSSYSQYKAGQIEDGTTGTWVAQAAGHSMPGGKSMGVVMPPMPRVSQTRFHQQFRAVDPGTGQAVAGLSYQVVLEDEKKFAGKTDADGKTAVIATNEPNAIQLFWGGPQTETVANEDIKDQGC